MVAGSTLTAVEELVATRVEQVGPAPYRQGEIADVWHELPVPLDPVYDPDTLAHLGFSVLTRSSDAKQGGPEQHRYRTGNKLRVTSAMDVVFVYRLRPTEQLADYRLAQRAARDILSAVNGLTNSADGDGDIVVRPTQRFSPLWDTEGSWLLVRVGVAIDHDEEL